MNPPQPPTDPDVTTWRNRFILLNLTRIGGTIVTLIGLAIWYSDWWRSGGAIEIGLPLALAGIVVSFLAPKYLARNWRTRDR